MQRPSLLIRAGGVIVALAGGSMMLINAVLTPLLPVDTPFGELAASSIFAWRQSLAVAATLLLSMASIALLVARADRLRFLGAIAFVLAFAGSTFLLAHEWNQVFFVRDLALLQPSTLEALEDAPGITLFDLSALIAVSTFTIGWLTFGCAMLIFRAYPPTGPWLLIAGFFLVPLLGAAFPVPWGMIPGNIVLGLGWIVLGSDLFRLAAKAEC